ncbi:MAG TPA: DUF2877 domain-containing protein [Actinomycetes bacterium]|nr:DUF2877 domain-containing protein [Actinomycetes bacterium]
MATLPAHLVATPVLERLAAGLRGELEGVVLGVGATAAWVDLDGFVLAITTREVPLLPNAIAVAAGPGALVRAGAGSGGTARLAPGRVTLGPLQVTWDPTTPPSWDPTIPVPAGVTRQAIGARGAALLRALGCGPAPGAATGVSTAVEGAVDNRARPISRSATLPLWGPEHPEGAEAHALVRKPVRERGRARAPELVRERGRARARELVRELGRIGLATAADPGGAAGLTLLFQAVAERDPAPAAEAVRALLGRGPGLTPEGDDLLAAVAGTLAVLGPVTVPDAQTLGAVLAAPAPIPGRTTALSATLLALALERRLPEPAGRLLDLSDGGEPAWPAALARLERLGHGSGRAYAAGIAATASLLAAADR